MTINKENLLNADYKIFKNGLFMNDETYLMSFEKRFDDEKGKKYFIHLNCRDFSNYNNKLGIRYDSEVQFNTDGETFNVNYFINDDTTIEQMEKFYENLWETLKCDYYELR